MGRARQKNAKFYVLVEEDKLNVSKSKCDGFTEFSEKLSDYLKANAEHLEQHFHDSKEICESEMDVLIPPFQPGEGPQKITASSCVSIVYRLKCLHLFYQFNHYHCLIEFLIFY
jgi:hypothetical protein